MRNQVLTGIVTRMADVMKEQDRRIEMLEYNNMKRSVVLTGFKTDFDKSKCIKQLYNFFNEEMGIDIQIDDIFYLNKMSTSPMVITLGTLQDKREIFRNTHNLKGLENQEGKPFIISDYLPPTMHDQKNRERDIFRECNSNENDDTKIEWKGGKLQIDDQPYKKGVHVPEPKEILQCSNAEIDQALSIQLIKG